MTVTKQQQLEWLAKEWSTWSGTGDQVFVSKNDIGRFIYLSGNASHRITRTDWQQERDKIQNQQDNSWHERGELPPVGCECWYIPDGKQVFIAAKHCAIDAVIFSSSPGAGELYYGYRCDFRPLRTEREKAIDELNTLVGDIEKYPTWRDAFAGIIDAGYRKEQAK